MNPTLLTAAILLGVTAAIILLFYLHQKSKKKQSMLQRNRRFLQLVNDHALQIGEKEEGRYYTIAYDPVLLQLLYIGHHDTAAEPQLIDLREVKSARVETLENQSFEERRGKQVIIDSIVTKVVLVITPKNDPQEKIMLPFYDLIHDHLEEMVQLKTRAAHWCELVNEELKDWKAEQALKKQSVRE